MPVQSYYHHADELELVHLEHTLHLGVQAVVYLGLYVIAHFKAIFGKNIKEINQKILKLPSLLNYLGHK